MFPAQYIDVFGIMSILLLLHILLVLFFECFKIKFRPDLTCFTFKYPHTNCVHLNHCVLFKKKSIFVMKQKPDKS